MSESLWQRLCHGVQRLRERPDWSLRAGAEWSERIMSVAVTDRFHEKQGRSTGRWILEAGGKRLSVYLKRHYRLPWWQGLLATLWPSRAWSPAMQEWQNLEWAHAQGLPVPAPVAAAEFIGPWGSLQSCLAVEELAGMLPLHEAIPMAAKHLEATAFQRWKQALAIEMARITRGLHARHHFHQDLYLCHFYIAEADTKQLPCWTGRVFLIDLHRLAYHPWTYRYWQTKDLAQLLYASEIVGVNARDRLGFWHAYLGAERRRWFGKFLRRCVVLRAARYQRHNLSRRLKAGKPGKAAPSPDTRAA